MAAVPYHAAVVSAVWLVLVWRLGRSIDRIVWLVLVWLQTPKDLDRLLRPQIEFLTQCRPHALSMGNAIRYFRQVLAGLPAAASVPTACKDVATLVEKFIDERVDVASAIGRLVGGSRSAGSCGRRVTAAQAHERDTQTERAESACGTVRQRGGRRNRGSRLSKRLTHRPTHAAMEGKK